MRGSDVCLVLLAIIFPPAAALIVGGCCDFLINLCLTLLGFIPGHIHAFWLIYLRAKAEEQYQGHYVYVGSGHFQPSDPSYANNRNNSRTHLQPQQPPPQAPPQQHYQQPPFNPRGAELAPGPAATSSGNGLPPAYKD
ncbi:hypothetical protein BDY24DRAFT_388423 [Mrakia frigida]|uniref:YqaE/Pmp3 family membrane protein n=1 Tax=Mrakia frigida TaxID=29902 RepID=UPI003FCC0D36